NEPYTDFLTGETKMLPADSPFPAGMTEHINQFLLSDVYPNGLDYYPNVFESPLMFPLQRQEEARKMLQIARSIAPKTIMDIGSDKGGGLYLWCKAIPSLRSLIACEIRGLPYYQSFENVFTDIRFKWLPYSSTHPHTKLEVSHYLNNSPPQMSTIDILFID